MLKADGCYTSEKSTFPGSQTSWAVPLVTPVVSDDPEEAATKDVTESLIKEVQAAVVCSNEIKLSTRRFTQQNKILPRKEDGKSRNHFSQREIVESLSPLIFKRRRHRLVYFR